MLHLRIVLGKLLLQRSNNSFGLLLTLRSVLFTWENAFKSASLISVMIPLSEKRIGTTVHLADNIIGCQLHTAPVTRRSGGDKKSETTPNQPKYSVTFQ